MDVIGTSRAVQSKGVHRVLEETLQSDGFPRVGRAPTFLNLKEGNSKNINLYFGNLEGVSEWKAPQVGPG